MSSIQTLVSLYKRDLDRLKNEMESYQQEAHLWRKEGSISNSAGNLCLHLIGNLKHFIGLILDKFPTNEIVMVNSQIPISLETK